MAEPSAPVSLTGVLERIIFLNEENHYTIAEFRPELPGSGERPGTVTIVGALPGVECGETLHLTGDWTRHEKHGAQFKIGSFKSELPSSVHGIRKYLGSGLVPGIGPVYADKIVDAFGADTFRVLSEDSGKLRQVAGIGKKRASSIKQAWEEKKTERELYVFLQTYGVTPGQCVKLVARYGADAKPILTREPYRVAREIDGIGFKTADRIAINLGFANDAPPRLDAGLLYALDALQEEGHTAFGDADLVGHAASLLEASAALIAARLEALVSSGQVVRHEPGKLVQLPVLDRAERRIAESFARLAASRSELPPIRIDAAIQWAETKARFAFHPLQRRAVESALANKLSILTGGPGTGKTTCLRALVEILKAKKARLHLASPTGRAAQRLAEATGAAASTIHRLLRYDGERGGFTVEEDHPLDTDFLIIDEASMLDTRLAAFLFAAVPPAAHLLLVGDTDQLPSVGAGNVLKDLIASNRVPVTRLEAVYRQGERSLIVATAHAVNSGDPSPPALLGEGSDADLAFVRAESPEECLRQVVRICTEFLPRRHPEFHPVNDVQILAPMHKGTAGVANLNFELQRSLAPFKRRPGGRDFGFGAGRRVPGVTAALRAGAVSYEVGDKVIQLRNNYEKNLFNGDIGVVTSVDPERGGMIAEFDGEEHAFERADLGDLALAHAITIHKSQGSEYPVVIVVLLKAHFMMLQRNLLYTAITRGRKKVFLVGDPVAYAMAVRNREARLRCTHLREKLVGGTSATGQPR